MEIDIDKLIRYLVEIINDIVFAIFALAAFGWLLLGCGWIGVAMVWSEHGKQAGLICLIINSFISISVLYIMFIEKFTKS